MSNFCSNYQGESTHPLGPHHPPWPPGTRWKGQSLQSPGQTVLSEHRDNGHGSLPHRHTGVSPGGGAMGGGVCKGEHPGESEDTDGRARVTPRAAPPSPTVVIRRPHGIPLVYILATPLLRGSRLEPLTL